jgi:hypothetical protein
MPAFTLNSRSLHSTDYRFAIICSGRNDRVGEIGTSHAKAGLERANCLKTKKMVSAVGIEPTTY